MLNARCYTPTPNPSSAKMREGLQNLLTSLKNSPSLVLGVGGLIIVCTHLDTRAHIAIHAGRGYNPGDDSCLVGVRIQSIVRRNPCSNVRFFYVWR